MNARSTRPGRAAPRLFRKWSATRLRFTTARSSFRCMSPKTWWATNWASSRRRACSRDTAWAEAPKRKLSHLPVRRHHRDRQELMISKATSRFIKMSPQKARLVVDLIRGKNVNEALMTLKFTNKRATREIEKVVKSAVANASQKSENIDVDQLFIESAFINEGPRLKRIRPAPMGRAYRYQRRTSHITIELGEKE